MRHRRFSRLSPPPLHWNFRRFLSILLFLLLFSLFFLKRQFIPPMKSQRGLVRVVKVIDGDTVKLSNGQTVRYAGIDAPERGQPFYRAAKNFNRKLTYGKIVELEFDVERYDRYGRLLSYVFVRDERGKRIFVNAEMVKSGFAMVYTKPPNVRYADLFVKLQREARERGLGLWSSYRPTLEPVIANKNTRVFHRLDCPLVRQISPRNRLRLPNAETALEWGFHPCRKCQP